MKRLCFVLFLAATGCFGFNAAPSNDGPPYACGTSTLDLHLASSVDYVQLRNGETPVAWTTTTEPCFTYDGRDACLAQLDAVRRPGVAVVTTTAERVEVIDDMGTLLALLGPIDTPDEASVVVAFSQNLDESEIDCTSNVVARGDGWDVTAWSASCAQSSQAPITRYHVTKDGTVSVVATDLACPAAITIW